MSFVWPRPGWLLQPIYAVWHVTAVGQQGKVHCILRQQQKTTCNILPVQTSETHQFYRRTLVYMTSLTYWQNKSESPWKQFWFRERTSTAHMRQFNNSTLTLWYIQLIVAVDFLERPSSIFINFWALSSVLAGLNNRFLESIWTLYNARKILSFLWPFRLLVMSESVCST